MKKKRKTKLLQLWFAGIIGIAFLAFPMISIAASGFDSFDPPEAKIKIASVASMDEVQQIVKTDNIFFSAQSGKASYTAQSRQAGTLLLQTKRVYFSQEDVFMITGVNITEVSLVQKLAIIPVFTIVQASESVELINLTTT